MNFFSSIVFLTTKAPTIPEGGIASMIPTVLIMVAIFGFMYFTMIRPENKRKKEKENMLKDLEVGDEITTIGGIVGVIVQIHEDELILETGNDRSKIIIKRWAIQQSNEVGSDEKPEA